MHNHDKGSWWNENLSDNRSSNLPLSIMDV